MNFSFWVFQQKSQIERPQKQFAKRATWKLISIAVEGSNAVEGGVRMLSLYVKPILLT